MFLQPFAWNTGKRFDFYRMPGEDNTDGIMRMLDWGEDESPRVLSMDDLDSIKDSKMMFARKFDFEIDSDIVRAVEQLVCYSFVSSPRRSDNGFLPVAASLQLCAAEPFDSYSWTFVPFEVDPHFASRTRPGPPADAIV